METTPLRSTIKVNFDSAMFGDDNSAGVGLTSIILEGDLKITIEALKCANPSLATFGNLIEEAKLLASNFTSIIQTASKYLDFIYFFVCLLRKWYLGLIVKMSYHETHAIYIYHYHELN